MEAISPSPPGADSSWKFERENREARRKLRINRKLQELEEDDIQLAAQHVNPLPLSLLIVVFK